jgi:hypothetical protein
MFCQAKNKVCAVRAQMRSALQPSSGTERNINDLQQNPGIFINPLLVATPFSVLVVRRFGLHL